MPTKPPSPCSVPSCPARAVSGGRCAAHQRQREQVYERQRGTATQRGYDARWERESKAFLEEHPYCVDCLAEGRYVLATEVHHTVPHKGNMVLFWDKSKWAGCCKSHHSAHTMQMINASR
ncbi:MAG: HNH endonuclease [Pseudomonadota bacterium]